MSFKFLFLSISASGHINPQLPLAAELIRRGHYVTYICGKEFKGNVENIGAHYIEGAPVIDLPVERDNPDDRLKWTYNFFTAYANRDIEIFEDRLVSQSFDAILFDTFSLGGHILTQKYQVTPIQLWSSFAPTKSISHMSVDREAAVIRSALNELLDSYFESHNVSSYKPTETVSENNISFLPRFFQPDEETFGNNFHFIGPTIEERINDDSWSFSGDPRPLIFISLGTFYTAALSFFVKCFEALGDGEYQILLAIGKSIDIGDLPKIPENFIVSTSFPQPKVLAHADLFLSHGGMNSSMEGICNEVPFLLYPLQGEQEVNAKKLIDLGVGQLLSAECLSEEIRKKVDEIIKNVSYKEKLKILAREIISAGGSFRGANIVENIVLEAKH